MNNVIRVLNLSEAIKRNENYLVELSKSLDENNIIHLIVDDDKYGMGIMIKNDFPSLITHDDEEKQWCYYVRYLASDDYEDIELLQKYVINDNNKKAPILSFIKVIVKISEGE